jgi:hypothetical protein
MDANFGNQFPWDGAMNEEFSLFSALPVIVIQRISPISGCHNVPVHCFQIRWVIEPVSETC